MNRRQKYQPANGAEGERFIARYCGRCVHDADEDNPCNFLGKTMVFYEDDPEYPRKWTYCNGNPCCTAFEERDSLEVARCRGRPTAGMGCKALDAGAITPAAR